jgi:predicted kinase
MKIQTRVHTVFMLVGPSGCGKSYFAENYLVPALKAEIPKANIQLLSSDGFRRKVLGRDENKYAPEMLQISDQAFALMYKWGREVMRYPVNSEFIISDTTGLSDKHREQILKDADAAGYNVELVIFDYKDKADYFKHLQEEETSKKITFDHIRRLRMEVLPALRRSKYKAIHRIKDKDFSTFSVEVLDKEIYNKTFMDNSKEQLVIGDVQGCFDEFLELLEKCKIRINNGVIDTTHKQIVFVGDVVDKGPKSKEMIEFLYNNIGNYTLVLGNHENFVYKYLKGKIKELPPSEIMLQFDSIQVFEADAELKEKFFKVVEDAIPFAKSKYLIVTHAPCKNKYLGKLSGDALRNQRNFIYPRKAAETPLEDFQSSLSEHLKFLTEDAVPNYPFHVFGHVALKRDFKHKNKIGVDTGCVHGNLLTAFSVNTYGEFFFNSVPAKQAYKPDELAILSFKNSQSKLEDIDLSLIEPREWGRIKWAGRNKVNYVSGTMSPSNKDFGTNKLESMKTALEYYKNAKIDKVVLQPKYMGSRCNVYLHREVEKSYATSRNGFLIKPERVDMTPVYKKLHEKMFSYLEKENVELVVLDGELLPWHALGKDLIERTFNVVGKSIETEIELLTNTGFEQELDKLRQASESVSFNKDMQVLKKSEMLEKYGHPKYNSYQNLNHFNWYPLTQQQSAYLVYKEQLELYGQVGELDFKPFAFLKLIRKDGADMLFLNASNAQMFSMLSEDKSVTVETSTPEGLATAEQFYNQVTENEKLEGVVVKPDKVYTKGVVPYLKVRNPRYLSIIYGYDYTFPSKFDKLFRQKNITRKARVSLEEFEIGKKLLEIPYAEISEDNDKYLKTMAAMVLEEKREVGLDPRL